MLSFRNIVFAFMAAVFAASPAFAGQTGWISGTDWAKKSDELSDQGFLPVKFECRDTFKPGFDLSAGEVRVTYTQNPKRLDWYWYATSNITTANQEMKEKGYHPVSVGQFVRKKSGTKAYCALYYKD